MQLEKHAVKKVLRIILHASDTTARLTYRKTEDQ
jgi:hypothetical protein